MSAKRAVHRTATTSSREFPPNGVGPDAEPEQLGDPLLPDADVVTITIGGNDALFGRC